ncbi:hypothetical protein PQQ67_37505 [Paraburkholderia aspalathi]
MPRQHSPGGTSRLYHVSRRGHSYLHTLLIHAVRAVLRFEKTKTDARTVWLQQLIARRGYRCSAVAPASHNERVIQASLRSDAEDLLA